MSRDTEYEPRESVPFYPGADVNTVGWDGMTPLHTATENGYHETEVLQMELSAPWTMFSHPDTNRSVSHLLSATRKSMRCCSNMERTLVRSTSD